MKKLKIVHCGVALWFVAGCRDAHDAHDHGEPKTAQITVWMDGYEVFAEHRAPVAGKATQFVTHLTDLRTQEPRREGAAKFVLRQGETVAEHSEPAPVRAGIYSPGIVFPKAGDWRLTLLIPGGGTNATVELGTIKVYADPHAAEHAEIPDGPDGVSFLKEQQWRIFSRTEPAANHRIVERVRVAARVRAKPGFSASIVVPVSGQLVAPSGQALPQPGKRVEAGQLLTLLKPNFSEAAARVAEADGEFNIAKAALNQAETAYHRTRKLTAEQAKSQRELQEAELSYQSAKARYAAAAGLMATFRQAGGANSPESPLQMELRAPIAGVLNSMTAGPGELVAANQTVFTVLNPEVVWIEANIPEASIARLGAARDAAIGVPGTHGQLRAITGEGRGQFVSLGLEVDLGTRTVPLIYEARNADGALRIGQTVDLFVETARAEATLALPGEAIVEEGGRPIAFVQLGGETFEKRELTLGLRDESRVQVLSGVKEGERVVTKGAYAVKLASMSSAIPAHGHAH